MSPITVKIGGSAIALDYDPTAASIDPSAIAVAASTYQGPYPILDNSSFRLSKDVGLAFISESFLQTGLDYLVFYSCSQGMTNDQNFATVQSQVYAFQGDFTDVVGSTPPAASYGKARTRPIMRASATPPHMRGCGLSGFCIFTSNGKPFQFAMQNVTGKLSAGIGDHNTAHFGGMSLVSIPLAGLVEGTDYWISKHPTDDLLVDGAGLGSTGSSGTFFDLTTLSFTVPEGGVYLVMACATGGTTNGGQTPKARLEESGNSGLTGWQQDTHIVQQNERRNYLFQKNRIYANGENVMISLKGESSVLLAVTQKAYYQPRILVLRLGAFESSATGEDVFSDVAVDLASNYPAYQEVVRSQVTPTVAQNVLILGQTNLYRTNVGSQVARIIDEFDGSSVHEFSAYTNVDGANADRATAFCCAAPIINFQHAYQMQVASEPGQAAGLFYSLPAITLIGMKLSGVATPGSQSIDIDDTSGGSDERVITSQTGVTGTLEGAAINDVSPLSQASADQVDIAYTPAVSGIPLTHPRIWVYNNGRKSYMVANSSLGTPSAQWTAWMSKIAGSTLQESWQHTLKYLVTGDSTDKTNALNKMFGAGGWMDLTMPEMMAQPDALYSRYPLRCMALMYDWMYADLTVTQRDQLKNAMLAICYCLLNNPGGGNELYQTTNWAVNNPYNNHFYQQRLGAVYAALSMFGAQPTTFTYKPNLVVRNAQGQIISTTYYPASTWTTAADKKLYNFSIPRYNSDGTTTFYADLWLWAKDQIETKIFPILDVAMAGGYTVEGTQYGKNSVKHMLEMFSIVRGTAGIDYINSHQVLADHGYYHIYVMAPGARWTSNQGDQSTDQHSPVKEDDRYIALLAADALTGYPVANHQQHLMNTYFPTMSVGSYSSGGTFEPYDFLLYNSGRAAIDYTDPASAAPLATHYFAPGVGFWVSRSDWGSSALAVFLKGGSRQNEDHGHSDFGALEMFLGPGNMECWLSADANGFAASAQNNAWSENFVHSTYQICTPDRPAGWQQHRFGNTIPVARETIGGGGGGGAGWDGGTSTAVILNEDFSAKQVLPLDNWWNKNVSAWPLDPNSATIIANVSTTSSGGNAAGVFHPDFGLPNIGIPIIGVGGATPLKPMVFSGGDGYANQSDLGQPGRPPGYPFPDEAKTQSGWMEQGTPANQSVAGDRHMIVVDRDNGFAYEGYNVFWDGTTWTPKNGACFQLQTNNRRPQGWTSGDAAGLCIFAGLVKWDDCYGPNPITHATRMSIRYSDGTYVYPASHISADDVPSNSPFGYPMGIRFRLKASFDVVAHVNTYGASLNATDKAAMVKLITSWKTYGLIVADRGGNGFVQGTMDTRWTIPAQYMNSVFHNLHFSSFEVPILGYNA